MVFGGKPCFPAVSVQWAERRESEVLSRMIVGVASSAVAFIDCDGSDAILTAGDVSADHEARILACLDPTRKGLAAAPWSAFQCRSHDVPKDRFALCLESEYDAHLTQAFLDRLWPLVRRECLRDAGLDDPVSGLDDELCLLDRVNVAILILDGHGLMYRLNNEARILLKDGSLLRRGRGGIFAADDGACADFRDAVHRCAADEGDAKTGETVLLTDRRTGLPVPVTITPFLHDGRRTRFVVATIPRPPTEEHIVSLARKRGLTPAEARVAALMQLGLTNRQAAERVGVSEQTVQTYSKRVMSKFNVSSRTQIAHLLTWQASGGQVP